MKKNKVLIVVVFVIALGGIWLIGKSGSTTDNASDGTNADNNPSFAESVDSTIVGIEPGAGIMINTEKAMTAYGLEDAGWSLQESSSAAMLSSMQDAIRNNKPIIATVWEPHAIFAITDIRKLDDPQNVYNNPNATRAFLEENAPAWADENVASDVIASVVYQGFSEDAPAADAFLEEFNIPSGTQSQWIYDYNIEEMDPETIAANYLEENQDLVDSWKPEDAELGKSSLTIGIPPWPGATVKSAVVKQILEDMGYTVEVKEMDAGVVYTALANKEIDINLAGWLPSTHQQYWEKVGDQLEIAGISITKTWLGLGVPSYAPENIQSIEDLKQ